SVSIRTGIERKPDVMSETITLPELGKSVTEGTVTRWLKEVGDTIEVDEPNVEISTDKVDTEIPLPVAGTLLEIKVQEDEDIEVGDVLALVGSGAAETQNSAAPTPEKSEPEPAAQGPEPAPEPAKEPEPQPEPSSPEPTAAPSPAPAPEATEAPSSPDETPRGDGYVTPLVRRLAREQGVDRAQVTGTGVGGRI